MNQLPDTMTVVEIREPGGPEVLRTRQVKIPEPQSNEVLIRVQGAGVNRPDIFQRKGIYPPPPGASEYPGLEVSGEIVAVGRGVTNWNPGNLVCALVAGGGYSEYCVAPAPQVLQIPKGISPLDAAGLPETFFTVWSNVFDRGRLKVNETLLVHGGSSGIGTTAIQMATALGSKVYATAGSAEKCTYCRSIGAVHAVNYREENFLEVVNEHSNGRGVDVILDMVGGEYFQQNIDCLASDGRLVLIALLTGAKGTINFNSVLRQRKTITGSTLRPQTVESKGRIARKLTETVWPLIEDGVIQPVIDSVFPLADAAAAHRYMETSKHMGKIILAV